jgi:DNA polymerase-1
MVEKKLFIAIDGNAIIHRAYHAYPLSLTTSTGLPVNAVYGFTVMLLEVLKKFDPKYVVCCFDTGKPTFRHSKFPDYKAHRKAPENELIVQFPLVRDVVKAFNIPIVEVDGYEADDSLGTLAKEVDSGKWSDQGVEMVIVSGDRDLLQLITPNVNVCLPQGNFKSLTVFNRLSTKEKYGYFPEQVTDYKALVGDPSDNIPGVKGVGEKSVLEMLEKYGNLDEIYKHLSDLKPRQAMLLAEGIEQAEFSKDLATIAREVPMSVKLEECVTKDFSRNAVVEMLMKFEFKSLIERIPSSHAEIQRDSVSDVSGGLQLDMFGEVIASSVIHQASSNEEFVASIEDLYEKYEEAEFADLIAVEGIKEAYFVYLDKDEAADGVGWLLIFAVLKEGTSCKYAVVHTGVGICEQVVSFTESLSTHNCETFSYNLEELFANSVSQYDTVYPVNRISKVVDLRILAHIVSAGSRGFTFESLVFDYLSQILPKRFSVSDVKVIINSVPLLKNKLIAKADSVELSDFVKNSVQKVRESVFSSSLVVDDDNSNLLVSFSTKFETIVASVIAEVESKGIMINIDVLKALKTELEDRISIVEKEVYGFVGHEFNLNSPKQLSNILYNELRLPTVRTGKNSQSTDEDTLNELQGSSEVIAYILESRMLKKLLGTYVDAFLEIVAKSGSPIIKTDYKMSVASSGRLSSQDPNLQNLPIKGQYASRFREVFIPRDGFKLVSIDYSQIELRMMAEISQDKDLIEIFKNGADIHKSTAAKIFGVTEEEVTNEQRQRAKTVNFGILYGQTAFGLSKQLNISREEAGRYIQEYFYRFRGVSEYIDNATKKAERLGFVESMFGRRRYISGLNAQNRMVKAAAVREAVNMPLQGSAADLMKLAMVVVDGIIKKDFKDKAFILLQVHDELIFEVKPEVLDDFKTKICDAMEHVLELSIPLEVHFSVGETLAELK